MAQILISKNTKFTKDMFGMGLGDGFSRVYAATSTTPASRNTTTINTLDGTNFGLVRTHDTECSWPNIEVAPGVYKFKPLDELLLPHKCAGRKVILTVYGTPNFYVSRVQAGPYSSQGQNTAPRDFIWLQNYVYAACKHFNDLGQPIDYVEFGNEPNWSTSAGLRFMDWAPTELYQGHKACWNGAKAVSPDIKIISAAMTGLDQTTWTNPADAPYTFFTSMMQAGDGAGDITAKYVDAIGMHFYGSDAFVLNRIALSRKMAYDNGLGLLPIIDTETGCNSTNITDEQVVLNRNIRIMLTPVAHGIPVNLYSLGNPVLKSPYSIAGHPTVLKGLSDLIGRILTHGIDRLEWFTDGHIEVTINGLVEVY